MALQPNFATRLNSFGADLDRSEKDSPLALLRQAAKVDGLTTVDLNYPDHVVGVPMSDLTAAVQDAGLTINGFAMRYYSDRAYRAGALAHPDPAVRSRALDLTLRGVDAIAEAGGDLLTVWLGQDGFDYPFQSDYAEVWDMAAAALDRAASHNPNVRLAIEYKPDEPHAHSLLADIGTTLLMISDVGRDNIGVCLDFAHVLYAGEQPAFAAALAAGHSKLYGLHLNDAYGRRDDGLMVGSIHTIQTIELLYHLDRIGYDGAIYFDTFPDQTGVDPVEECRTNIMVVRRMLKLVETLRDRNDLSVALGRRDTIAGQRIVQEVLLANGQSLIAPDDAVPGSTKPQREASDG